MMQPANHHRRRVLITGAARGIGRSIAELLHIDYDVVVAGRNEEAISLLAGALGATPAVFDLADTASIETACQDLPDLDAAIHCGGIQGTAPASDLTPEFLSKVLAVNLTGPVELTRQVLPGLQRRGGKVVFINSTAVLGTFPNWAAYSASKAGLRSYADTLRIEQRKAGVRVTTIFPGRTDTGMQREMNEARGTVFDPSTAMAPESVASAVGYVLSAPDDVVLPELTVNPFPPR